MPAKTHSTTHKLPHQRREAASTVSFEHKDRYIDNREQDGIMTAEEYKALAKQICSTLRSPHDPPPRLMAHGDGPWNTPCTNVRELLHQHQANGAVLVRGYRLLTVQYNPEQKPETKPDAVWKAVFHAVVAHPPKDVSVSNKWIYECATAPEDIADRKRNFLFVPSSRAHTELTDAQLLTGDWLLGLVIGGHPLFCEVVAADNAARGRERSMVCVVPERCIAKRRLVFRFFPRFLEWFKQKPRHMPVDSMAELMGFPAADAAERAANPTIDYFDEEHIEASIERNTSALVDGGRISLRLEQETERALFFRQQTFDRARARWLAHYDELLDRVEKIMEDSYQTALAQLGIR